jgi:hypothetical protein
MGLTVHYGWKTKIDLVEARRLVEEFRALALALPFDEVSDVYEQNPLDGDYRFVPYDDPFHRGDLYLSRTRGDGKRELVCVPAKHAVFFSARIEGAESVSIGLASHPPVVVHREDVIERDDDGSEFGRIVGAGDPIEFPTQLRGMYSWQSSCKTQYAGNPKLGGEVNFLRAHLSLIELLDQIGERGVEVKITDDSEYAAHRDVERLLSSLRRWDGLVAGFVGRICDEFGEELGEVIAPIKERPDFEHLEAKGVDELRKLAARQRRRRGGASGDGT